MSYLGRLVVGISGASCTGKTTLTKLLKATYPWASVIHQDQYYYPNDPKYHVYLPDVKGFNWDIKSAVDFAKMEKAIEKVLRKEPTEKLDHCVPPTNDASLHDDNSNNEELLHCPNDDFVKKNSPQNAEVDYLASHFSRISLTILEGHILFSHSPFFRLCGLKYFLTLDQHELFSRRRRRIYIPPNPSGYLEKYVWPAHVSRLEEVRQLPGIQYVDAKDVPLLDIYQQMKQSIALEMATMISPSAILNNEDLQDKSGVKQR